MLIRRKLLLATMFFVVIVALVGAAVVLVRHRAESRRQAARAAQYAREAERIRRDGLWVAEIDTSVMDDDRLVTLALESEGGLYAWLLSSRAGRATDRSPKDGPRTLYLRCARHQLSVYLYLRPNEPEARLLEAPRGNDPSYGVAVRFRLDHGAPRSARWSASSRREAIFAPDPEELLGRLAEGDTLLLQYDFAALDSTSIGLDRPILTFNLAKLERHLSSLRSGCK